jgi:hypothetical protein
MSFRWPLFGLPFLVLGCAHMGPQPASAEPSLERSLIPVAAPAARLQSGWPATMPALIPERSSPEPDPSVSAPPSEPPAPDPPPAAPKVALACPAARASVVSETPISADEIPSGPECRAELDRLGVRHGTFSEPTGLVTLRNDSLGGVRFRGLDGTPLVADCRLILAFQRLSSVLERAGVTEVRYSGAYSYRMSRTGRLSLHAYGLAVDVHALVVDGKLLEVERDFRRGLAACPCAGQPPLNRVACTLRSVHLFRELLTPDYDRDHQNHVHLGLAPSKTDKPIPMVARAKVAPTHSAPTGVPVAKQMRLGTPRRPSSGAPASSAAGAEHATSSTDDSGWFDRQGEPPHSTTGVPTAVPSSHPHVISTGQGCLGGTCATGAARRTSRGSPQPKLPAKGTALRPPPAARATPGGSEHKSPAG